MSCWPARSRAGSSRRSGPQLARQTLLGARPTVFERPSEPIFRQPRDERAPGYLQELGSARLVPSATVHGLRDAPSFEGARGSPRVFLETHLGRQVTVR